MEKQRIIEKVTAFITRKSSTDRDDLLLFEHPYAGIQIPAGTIEDGETPEAAALREAFEETGLTLLSIRQYLGSKEQKLPEGQRIILEPTKVYARPDESSFDWAYLRKGIAVTLSGRRADGFSQVTYEELDSLPNPQYVTMSITGWVPDAVLAEVRRRHFFHLEFEGQSEEKWAVCTDNHHFTLFWASMEALPNIIHPQDAWLAFLKKGLPSATSR